MDWEHLFHTQNILDKHIAANHQLAPEQLMDKKILALLVEVGELANETRCFKFWSNKQQSEKSVILEEYVDGLHFILSIGLDRSFSYESGAVASSSDITEQFNRVFEQIIVLKRNPSKETYKELFDTYITLGYSLGFTEQDIMSSYDDKNKVNHQRQEQGY
ncbi:dUTP diphosphatase [Sediminibacillus massiliensis]|uniref:dUTP diphosphatase n=1 Tax=Sediminibacillus massiliensis TaxID=1926277 RepID=UPI00098835E9|nr:dUTP diphosphatase [Sediminibacillus massiliensis]